MFRQTWERLSPDGPEHFPVVFDKLKPNWLALGISLKRLGDVQSPTLVLIGDNDCPTAEHGAAMVRALPEGSRLAVVPGTSHGLPFEKPDLVSRLMLDFLAPQPTQTSALPTPPSWHTAMEVAQRH
jgi:pimeloyl-ACP methyl ester carboxylesterase